MLSIEALSLDSVMLDEVRNYLRLESDQEDAALGAILLAAIGHAERFTGQILIRRAVRQTMAASPDWQRLSATPVGSVITVSGIPADGAAFALNDTQYTVRIDANDDGYISVSRSGAAGRIEVRYEAGLAQSWAALPDSLRLAVLRMTGHWHLHRDSADDAGPPAAVAILLRPWRRLRIAA